MKLKHKMILLDPDPTGVKSGGGSAPAKPAKPTEPNEDTTPAWLRAMADAEPTEPEEPSGDDAAADDEPEPTAAEPVQPTAPQSMTMTPDQLKDIVSSAVKNVGKGDGAQPQQYTEEDYKRMFNIFQATPEDLQVLGIEASPDKAVHFNNMLQAVAKQAVTLAAYQMAVENKKIQEAINPLRSYMQEQAEAGMRQRFFQKNPDLEGLDLLLTKIRDSYVREGRTFGTEDEAFQAVATEARAIITQARGGAAPTQGAPAGAVRPATTPKPARQMTTLSRGGQGGAGDTKPAGKDVPTWKRALS